MRILINVILSIISAVLILLISFNVLVFIIHSILYYTDQSNILIIILHGVKSLLYITLLKFIINIYKINN